MQPKVFLNNPVEEKQEEAKSRAEQEEQRKNVLSESEVEDGYTSLYFNPDKSENDYEEVDHEKYNAMKSIRESLLKELRKDLGRFVKSERVCRRDKNPAEKCVKVRPGLAMGVITLQAGSRGEKITLN